MRIPIIIFGLYLVSAFSPAWGRTILIGDLYGGGANDSLTVGLPYLIARELGGSEKCEALLPTSPIIAVSVVLYKNNGMPKINEAIRLCGEAGADRYLLGSYASKRGNPGLPASTIISFYLGSTRGGKPEVFKAQIDGDAGVPACAEHVASRICPGTGKRRLPAFTPQFLSSFSRTFRLLRDNDLSGASFEAGALAEKYPDSSDALYLEGLIALREGKQYEALGYFTKSRNMDPLFSFPAYEEGLIWLSLKRGTLAERAFADAARSHPGSFRAVSQLGILEATRGDYNSAQSHLDRADKLRPGTAEVRYWLAFCLAETGKASDGKRMLEKIITAHPGYGPARLLLGRLYFQSGEYPRAEAELRRAVKLCPGNADAHRLLGETLSRQGGYARHAEAVIELRRALILMEQQPK